MTGYRHVFFAKKKPILAISIGLRGLDNKKVPFPDKMRGERTLYDQPFMRYWILVILTIF